MTIQTAKSSGIFMLLFLGLISLNALGQNKNIQPSAHCGSTMEAHEYRMANDAAYRKHVNKINSLAETYMGQRNPNCANGPLIIPIAVHFNSGNGLPTGATEEACAINLAYNMINKLNDDFNGTNPDAANYNSNFGACLSPLGISCVEFCLASQNHPAGYGLNNNEPAVTFGQVDFTIPNGNFTPVNAEWSNHINIYVDVLSGGLLGVSNGIPGQFNGDGVMVNACQFGGPGVTCSGFNHSTSCGGLYDEGETVSHELGHYFGLFHIWGDDGTACTGSDQINDTPNIAGNYSSYTNCNDNSCADLPETCGSEDMYMSFMSYASDGCMYMFSSGQADQVYAVATAQGFSSNGSPQCTPSCELEVTVDYVNSSAGSPAGFIDVPIDIGSAIGNLTFDPPGIVSGSGTNGDPYVATVDGGAACSPVLMTVEDDGTNLDNSANFNIISPSSISGEYAIGLNNTATWGIDINSLGYCGSGTTEVTGGLVLVDDLSNPVTDFCQPDQTTGAVPTAAQCDGIAGKIAVIDRGNCDFTNKVENAQECGAIAVIICNNDTANPNEVVLMGGASEDPVTIPTVMLSYNNCQAIKIEMATGNVLACLGSQGVIDVCQRIFLVDVCQSGGSGCTNPAACNFDPFASSDDGTCLLPDGCTDPTACNFNAAANCDDGSCTVAGCNDPAACNFDPAAVCNDGSCEFPGGPNCPPINNECTGAIDISSAFPDCPSLTTVFGTYDNTLATSEPSDLTYTSYTGNEVNAAGTCCLCEINNNSDNTELHATMWYSFTPALTGNYFIEAIAQSSANGCGGVLGTSEDTQILIYESGDGSCNSLSFLGCNEDGVNATATNYPAGESFNFIAGTTYYLIVDEYYVNGLERGTFCVEVTFEDTCPVTIPGCTNPSACNYDNAATIDDGTCILETTCDTDPCTAGGMYTWSAVNCQCEISTATSDGCTDVNACNYDASANCDDGTCILETTCDTDPCINGGVFVWDDLNCQCALSNPTVSGCTNANACNYDANANCNDGSCILETVCDINPCTNGGVYSWDVNTCQCELSTATVFACIDPTACNFDNSANCDDGSCLYIIDCLGVCGGTASNGCTDPTACNYDINADCDDSSCLFAPCLFACTDPCAPNYNAAADGDDGSCETYNMSCNTDPCLGDVELWDAVICACVISQSSIDGCTDATACNFDVLANCDNGSCIFVADCLGQCGGTATEGCTDASACNFDAAADCDDSSCDFTSCAPGGISSTIYVDDNDNGEYDNGEATLGGVGVMITFAGLDGVMGNADDQIFNTSTAANGSFLMTGLPAGFYTVSITLPAGYKFTGGSTFNMYSTLVLNNEISFVGTGGEIPVLLDLNEGCDLDINLISGWNIISSYCYPVDPDMPDVFNLISPSVIQVKDLTDVYVPALNYNTMDPWNISQGYQVKVSSQAVLAVNGTTEVDPTVDQIPLDNGWNIIAYWLKDGDADPSDVFDAYAPNVIQVKNLYGAYAPALSFNGMGNMTITQGYQVKMSAPDVLMYNPADGIYMRPLEDELEILRPQHFVRGGAVHPNNTTLIIKSPEFGMMNYGDEIGVFTEDGLLVGSGVYQGGHIGMLVYGNEANPLGNNGINNNINNGINDQNQNGINPGEAFYFKVWDKLLQKENSLTLEILEGPEHFQKDALTVAQFKTNTALDNLSSIEINAVPNPVSDHLVFNIELNEMKEELRIQIYNMEGKLLEEIINDGAVRSGLHQLSYHVGHMADGIYMYKLIADGEIVAIEKLIVAK